MADSNGDSGGGGSLRRFRFQRRDPPTPGSNSNDNSNHNSTTPVNSPGRSSVIPETPDSLINSPVVNTYGRKPAKRVIESDTDSCNSPVKIANGVSSGSSTCASSQSTHVTSPPAKIVKLTGAEAGKDKEQKLQQVHAKYPNRDLMDLQDLLVMYDWNVNLVFDALALPSTSKAAASSNNINSNNAGMMTASLQNAAVSRVVLNNHQSSNTEGRGIAKKNSKKKRGNRRADNSDDSDLSGPEDADTYHMDEDIYDSDEEVDNTELTAGRQNVYTFYEKATLDDLLTVPGCSLKRAQIIMAARPFTYAELVSLLEDNKQLSAELLNGAKIVLQCREVVSRLMKRCEKLTSDTLGYTVNRLIRGEPVEGTLKVAPRGLNSNLKLASYQLIGVNWLYTLYKAKVSGILADEMGLGKTIQTIAFLTHLRNVGVKGPFCIVVPSSTLVNWQLEFEQWAPNLAVLIYHGPQEERKLLRYQLAMGQYPHHYDVLISTYNLAVGSTEDRVLFRRIGFSYVVFDEAHMLKNMATQRYQQLLRIKSKHRLLLTGTPLQNTLLELISLLMFVMPDMFVANQEHLKFMFQRSNAAGRGAERQSDFEKDRIEHARKIMKPFILRRLKVDVLADLPKKTEEIVRVPLTPTQLERYESMKEAIKRQDYEYDDDVATGLSAMMQLRKLSNHELLLREFYTDQKINQILAILKKEPEYKKFDLERLVEDFQAKHDFEIHSICYGYGKLNSFRLSEDQICTSAKLSWLDDVLPEMRASGDRVLIFSQFVMMLDILQAYCYLRGFNYLRLDGSTPVMERQGLIERYNSDNKIFLFLLSTKAGGLGINLTAANTVILHDIDFNPYNDKQAEDRCHRVGQTRPVKVIRLVSENTIEEAILSAAESKLRLAKHVEGKQGKDEDQKVVLNVLKMALRM